jgi:hypothetical protein
MEPNEVSIQVSDAVEFDHAPVELATTDSET